MHKSATPARKLLNPHPQVSGSHFARSVATAADLSHEPTRHLRGRPTNPARSLRARRWTLACVHLAFLCAVCLIPFSTSPLAEFVHYGIVLLVDRFNIFSLGLTLDWSWSCDSKNKPSADDFVAETHPGAVVRRIMVAQSLYACGAGFVF